MSTPQTLCHGVRDPIPMSGPPAFLLYVYCLVLYSYYEKAALQFVLLRVVYALS